MPSYFIDLERLKYPNNGLYHFNFHLANELLNLINQDEKLIYYLPENTQTLFKQQKSIQFINYRPWHKWLMNTEYSDVWHVTHQSSYFAPSNAATKCILTIHDLNFLYTNKSENIKKGLLKNIQKKINRANHIVVISKFIQSEIEKYLDVKGKPISVIYNGYSLMELKEGVTLPVNPKGEFLFTIGAIHPKKNTHVLAALLTNNSYQLVIAGVGSENYKQQIINEAKVIGVENRLLFTGAITEEQKVWYYAHCKAFVFPSLSEGFGIPVVEALAMGKPVFLSNRTSLPEIGGKYAYYFDSFETSEMLKVFNAGLIEETKNPQLKEERKLYASKFSWKTMAKEYLALYRLLSE